jgi:DNA invertase Pin-like site-specific DNA recombinase
LGLEAQQAALVRFAEAEGFDLVQTFEEVETGKGADALNRRPQLAAALKAAKRLKSPIILVKLDRLSRDVHFISGLMTHKNAIYRGGAWSRRGSFHAAPLRRAGKG